MLVNTTALYWIRRVEPLKDEKSSEHIKHIVSQGMEEITAQVPKTEKPKACQDSDV